MISPNTHWREKLNEILLAEIPINQGSISADGMIATGSPESSSLTTWDLCEPVSGSKSATVLTSAYVGPWIMIGNLPLAGKWLQPFPPRRFASNPGSFGAANNAGIAG